MKLDPNSLLILMSDLRRRNTHIVSDVTFGTTLVYIDQSVTQGEVYAKFCEERHKLNEEADNLLVAATTSMMTEKLAVCRDKGRGGWWCTLECSKEHLRSLLHAAVLKGDMIDVVNLAAMLMVRDEVGQ